MAFARLSWSTWAYLRRPGAECFTDDFCFLAACFAGGDDLPRAFLRSALDFGARLEGGGEGGFALTAAAAAAFSRRAFS
eukprot:scaffold127360_cov78-Cyclotella_meneghiniana.AAC.1